MHIHLFLKPVIAAETSTQHYVTRCQMSLHMFEVLSGTGEGGITESMDLQNIFTAQIRFFNQFVLHSFNAKR